MSGRDPYRAAFDSALDALLLIESGRVKSANVSATRLLVGAEGRLVGRELASLSPPLQPDGRDSVSGFRERLDAALAGTPQHFRWVYLRPGSGLVYTEVWVSLLDDGDASGSLLLATVREENKEQRRLYALAVDMLGIAGLDGRFRELSPSWERTLGFTREELMARPYLDFIHPEDKARTLSETDAFSTGARTLTYENRYLCKDGSYRWLEWNAMLALDEGLVYFVARDVTRRKEAEQALRESEEKIRSLFEGIPHTVMVFATDGRILSTNRVVPGLAAADILGRNMLEFVPPPFHKVVTEAHQRVVETGEPTHYETMGVGPHGTSAWYSSRVSAVRSDGEVTGVLVVTEDVSDRKRLEEQLHQSIQRLESYADELEGKNRMLAEENAERERTAAVLLQQQEAIRALSTPIIQAWDGVLALPIIGVLDGARATQIMEKLLGEIVRTRAGFAVLDLTGVEAVDAPTLDHLLQVARAASLLGSRCLISGISPEVAQAMVELGSDADAFDTFAGLQDALRYALGSSSPRSKKRRGLA